MTSVRLALLSDIHGNLPALEAVMGEIRAAAPDRVYVLGDVIHGYPWSAETLDAVVAEGWPLLLGNHDDAVLQLATPRMEPRYADRRRYPTLWWTWEHLTNRHLQILRELKTGLRIHLPGLPELRLFHGMPGNFFVGLRPDSPEPWATRWLVGVREPVIGCGHTHVPMWRKIGRWQVANCGAVGAPYDADPRAAFLLLDADHGDWRAEIRRVAYDLEAVATGFRASGMQAACGVICDMFLRSALDGLPWVADFGWWLREQPRETTTDMERALAAYDSGHGPGRWAFPYLSKRLGPSAPAEPMASPTPDVGR